MLAKSTNRFVGAIAGLGLFACGTAYADELTYDWSGLYIGINGGYAFGKDTAVPIDTGDSSDIDGGFFGGQAGYNLQSGNFVYGVEADVAWSGIENDLSNGSKGSRDEYVEIKSFGTLRGRAGYAADNALFYVTGGLAIAGVRAIDWDAGTASESHTHFGYAIGGGVEYGFTSNISAKLEYLYMDLGHETYNLGTPDKVGIDGHFIKAGVNFSF